MTDVTAYAGQGSFEEAVQLYSDSLEAPVAFFVWYRTVRHIRALYEDLSLIHI